MAATATVVPAYSGGSIFVPERSTLTVTDLEGQQVGDLWAVDARDPGLWLSVSHTRDRLERLFPRLGQSFTDQRGEPLLEYVEDSSPGMHDTLYAACDRWLYEAEGFTDHPNCRDNFLTALAGLGIALPVVPDPVNLFQNSAPQPDGSLTIRPTASAAGDAVTFRAPLCARDPDVVFCGLLAHQRRAVHALGVAGLGVRCTILAVSALDAGARGASKSCVPWSGQSR